MAMSRRTTVLATMALLGTASASRSAAEIAAEVELRRATYHWPTGEEALGIGPDQARHADR